MKFHGVQIQEGSSVVNLTAASGASFPANPNNGELFYKNGDSLYVYTEGNWLSVLALPAGSNTSVQFNDNGARAGDTSFVYNKTTNALTVPVLGLSASSTARAALNLPAGVAPTAPVNGDVWTTSTGLFSQVNGSSVQFAALASPAFTGTPTTSTAAVDTNTTQIASTAFVIGQAAASNPLMNGAVAVGTATRFARADHVHPVDTSRLPVTITTAGDLIYSSAGSTAARLGIGSSGQILTVVSGLPAWSTAPYMLNPMTTAQDLIVGGASGAPGRLGVGTNGQVLTVSAGVVSWASPVVSSGDVVGPASSVNGNITTFSGTTGKLIQDSGTALTALAPLASPTFTGTPAAPTATGGTNTTQIATTAFVTSAVSTKANLASPTFTGTPAAPTATAGTNTTQLATTAFVTTADNLKANLASPTFTGTPAAPTAAVDTSTTQLSTTAFVIGQAAAVTPQPIGAGAVGTATRFARADHVHPSVFTTAGDLAYSSSGATEARLGIGSTNQILTVIAGLPAWVTPSFMTNPMTTAQDLIVGGTSGAPTRLGVGSNGQVLGVTAGAVTWVNPAAAGGNGDVVGPASSVTGNIATFSSTTGKAIQDGGVALSALATLASPILTGTPQAPTAAVDTSTTQIASTAFVIGQAAAATPQPIGAGAVGTSTRFARADHIHPSVFTTAGDIVYSSAGSTEARLGIGSTNQILTVVAGLPAWVSPSFMMNPMTTAQDLIVGGTLGAPSRLGVGSNGQVLTVTTGAVGWAAPASDASKANLASPTFTGTPAAPTAAADTNTTQLATTAFVVGQASTTTPVTTGAAAIGTSLKYARADHVHQSVVNVTGDLLYASAANTPARLPIGSNGQILTIVSGLPAWGNNTALTNPMTTAQDLIVGGTSGAPGRLGVGTNGQVLSVSGGVVTWATPASGGGSGDVVGPASSTAGNLPTFSSTTGKAIQDSGVAVAALAPLASPTFTGTPAAPTATAGTSTTQLATTAFVTTADALKANLASPTFTGTPAAPTAAAGTTTTQIATTAYVYNNFARLAVANTFTKTQSVTPVALTSGTTIAVNAALSNNFTLTLAVTGATLSNPTNLVAGTVYNFTIRQDATGGRTLAYGTSYKFSGGTPALSTAASAVDFLSCYYDGTTLLCVLTKAFA